MSNVYLNEDNVDDLGRMLVAMLSEMWILRDRVGILEELLTQGGTIAAGAVDGFEWSAEKTAEMEAIRDRMVGAVLGAPIAAQERSVEQILARAGYRAKAEEA